MTEPRIHVSTGFGGGVSVNFRADTPAELEALVQSAASNSPTLARLMQQVGLTAGAPTPAQVEQQALANIQQTFPQSTVGQPLPQPGVVAAQPAATYTPAQPAQQSAQATHANMQRIPGPAGAPPNVAYPGPCAHGDRVFTDKAARGKPWPRWECNIPWSRNAQGRCESVNV